MRIAFITGYRELGGGETNLVLLSRELKNAGHEVLVCCPPGRLVEFLAHHGIPTLSMPFLEKLSFRNFVLRLGPIRRLRRALLGFDVAHFYSINILPIALFLRMRRVWTNHGPWENPNGPKSLFLRLAFHRILQVNPELISSPLLQARTHYVPLGTALVRPESRQKEFDFICVARFQPIKGQLEFLQALKAIAPQYSAGIKVLFLGGVNNASEQDQNYMERCLTLMGDFQANLTVVHRGFVSNPRDFMVTAKWVVVPSRYESFSMVTIEAFDCGLPVIGPNLGGPKALIHPGVGLLFDPNDPPSLERSLAQALSMDSVQMEKACRAESLKYGIERQAERTMRLAYEN